MLAHRGRTARAAAQRIGLALLPSMILLTPPAAAQSLTGTANAGGAQLSYVVEGSGRPCIVMGVEAYYVRAFPDALKKVLRCAFMDLQTVERAPRADTASYSVRQATDDVEAVRRSLGWERVVVFGHSVHGLIALEYARRYPEHVTQAVVVGSAPFWGPRLEAAHRAFWEKDASRERKAALQNRQERFAAQRQAARGSDAIVLTFVSGAPRFWFDLGYDGASLWRGIRIDTLRWSGLFASAASYDVRVGPSISRPVFVALGRYDYTIPYTTWSREYLAALPRGTVQTFAQSGHSPFMEQPVEFAQRLAAWLDATSTPMKAAPRRPDVAAVDALRDGWRAAAAIADVDRYMSFCAPDVVAIMPGAPPLDREGLRALARKFVDGFRIAEEESVSSEIVVSGDWAFDRGSYRAKYLPLQEGPPVEGTGHYLYISHRQRDGSWKLARLFVHPTP